MSYSDNGGDFGRAQIGFLWSVLIPASVVAVVTLFLFRSDSDPFLEVQIFVATFVTAAIIIGIAGAVIGLPVTWALARYNFELPWVYPAAGFVAGGAVVLAVLQLPGLRWGAWFTETLPFALIGALPGCLCGQSWWWFHRRHARSPKGSI